ncbi:CBS domain-containing protein [Gilvimarinus agarilyticus]|uniref:CBS domain-containing protein n=1 Tax=unclassified Gilvimarinus TaxID=2642066 RepID=UPI001C085DED|nr:MULTISPECIES: CBS domain-containing protein [unclassified Gilvimarinus]MBU2884416.1 CBS domain-containing protein [Gilvimarinus agarilyticus]MDO6569552.1 CBS domain-containing protein [Gilvimarinus sp. 2_MG-2023]MDO6748123.1 CBS domain-containing protein [Gilvimarinus sp. 1_MG-2023]
MKVTEFMSSKVVVVEMDDTLKTVQHLFDKTTFHHLLVVDKQQLVGVISDRDLLRALSPNIGTAAETTKDLASLNKKAHQIMTRNPATLTPDAGLPEAVQVFNEQSVSCIPIIDDERHVKGIVSWRDIMRTLGAAYAKARAKT